VARNQKREEEEPPFGKAKFSSGKLFFNA